MVQLTSPKPVSESRLAEIASEVCYLYAYTHHLDYFLASVFSVTLILYKANRLFLPPPGLLSSPWSCHRLRALESFGMEYGHHCTSSASFPPSKPLYDSHMSLTLRYRTPSSTP